MSSSSCPRLLVPNSWRTPVIPVALLRNFRKRIDRHNRIRSFDIAGRYTDILTVTSDLDVDLATWIDDRSRGIQLLVLGP